MNKIKFLDHIIPYNIIKPDFDRVKYIKVFKIPENKKQLESFLGLM